MRRPWNLVNVPIYSLATYDGGLVNMNIASYVSAVSMKPKRYIVAVYNNTKTLENIARSSTAVLQLLGDQQASLVNVLGKKSGKTYNKHHYLEKKNALTMWNNYIVLDGCASIIELKKLRRMDAGDHTMFLFDIGRFITQHSNVLTMDHLRERKIVSI